MPFTFFFFSLLPLLLLLHASRSIIHTAAASLLSNPLLHEHDVASIAHVVALMIRCLPVAILPTKLQKQIEKVLVMRERRPGPRTNIPRLLPRERKKRKKKKKKK
ncbi:uncharacterized protein IWZ02DRAFT_457956, partial [Phyllosticta citriasiana]|uniref:uncharacterized protein n=1 Tax=Phyllosticta citriasiana TaxID=595635 RepID=UPI0030FD7DA9